MTANLTMPLQLRMNAFSEGRTVTGGCSGHAQMWTFQNEPSRIQPFLRARVAADLKDWRDPRVGWGLVMPDNPHLSPEQLSTAADAPEPIRSLVHQRAFGGNPAPVFRYIHAREHIGYLRRGGYDLPVNQSSFGTGPAHVPRYLLIYGGPDQIPWSLQYSLNATRFVGRLSMQGVALENYINALMNDWRGAASDNHAAVVWAADHGGDDITSLMRLAIAAPVVEKFRDDAQLGPRTRYIDGSTSGGARTSDLIRALQDVWPGIIVTTSHGMTGPLHDIAQMASQLGLLVDNDKQMIRPEELLSQWQPEGAVWYAHACCSAGSDSETVFSGLFEPGSEGDQVLQGVAKCGALVSPLPLSLLGAKVPLRAFVGHVEPTFDWTVEHPLTKQFTTDPLTEALYDELFQPAPVGLAMSRIFNQLGGLYTDYHAAMLATSKTGMLHRLLVARDIQSTVILGDPTVALRLES